MRIRGLNTYIILLFALLFSTTSLADEYADTDGDGYSDTIKIVSTGITIEHPETGQSDHYFIKSSLSTGKITIFRIVDTNGAGGAEVLAVYENGLYIIDDTQKQKRSHSLGSFYGLHYAIDMDGQPGSEIVVSGTEGRVFVINDALNTKKTFYVDQRLPTYDWLVSVDFSGYGNTNGTPGNEVVLWRNDSKVLIIDYHYGQVDYYDLKNPGVDYPWSLISIKYIRDVDGKNGDEIVVWRNDQTVHIINDAGLGVWKYEFDSIYNFQTVIDTDGEAGEEIIIVTNDFVIHVLDHAEHRIREYNIGKAFKINNVIDLDGSPGAEICYTTTFTSPPYSYRIVDRTGIKYLDNSCADDGTNGQPVANAGPDLVVDEGAQIVLDGSKSSYDGMVVNYLWWQIRGPSVWLSSHSYPQVTFTAPEVNEDTYLEFRLTITDQWNNKSEDTVIVVIHDKNSNADEDKDGLPDQWEREHFGNTEQTADGDKDEDGITNLGEYVYGTDPNVANPPFEPYIEMPLPDNEIYTPFPWLTVSFEPFSNPEFTLPEFTNPELTLHSFSVEYELYSDKAMTDLVASATIIPETSDAVASNQISPLSSSFSNSSRDGSLLSVSTSDAENTKITTTWKIQTELMDNRHYYWRARVFNGYLYSEWTPSSFFVNTENDAPAAYDINQPEPGSHVASATPTLEIQNSIDIDEDTLTYSFYVYSDADMTQLVTSMTGVSEGNSTTAWKVNKTLIENTWYYWRSSVTDEHGLTTESSTGSFFVNTVNSAPEIPVIVYPLLDEEVTQLNITMSVTNSTDVDNYDSELLYYFEIDKSADFSSDEKQVSDPLAPGFIQTLWYASELEDNTWYYWRVRVFDGKAYSKWLNAKFFVNTINDAPSVPTIMNPGNDAWVGTLEPALSVYPALDVDGDALSYEFQVFAVKGKAKKPNLITSYISYTTFWQVSALPKSGWYSWRVRAIDEHGLAGAWSDYSKFYVDDDGINETPKIMLGKPKYVSAQALGNKEYLGQNKRLVMISWSDRDPDSNAVISLYYSNTNSGESGQLIVSNINENPDGKYDMYLWDLKNVLPGEYYIYAEINDGVNRYVSYSPSTILINTKANSRKR